MLGHLNYWLGMKKNGRPRTPWEHRYANPVDGNVYMVVTARFMGKRLAKTKQQVQRILRRLKKAKLIVAERHKRSEDEFATRIRLNWERIVELLDQKNGMGASRNAAHRK